MAVIPGFLLPSDITLLDEVNPNISTDIETLTGPTPSQLSDAGNIVMGSLITHWPVEANGVSVPGFLMDGYVDDFYHRIHVNPSKIELGNIVTAQTTPVKIWNAYFRQQLLLNIINLQEGLELTGQPSPPLGFKILQELEYNVGVTTEGPAVLDVEIIFQFSSGGVGTLAITGNRITAFPWRIDWSNGVQEKLVWATDILQSETLIEQRRALRIAPRRMLSAEVLLHKRERQSFDVTMFAWVGRVWAIPVWFDVQLLGATLNAGAVTIACDTQYRDFRAGGLAMLLGETSFQYETVEILSYTNAQLTLKRPTLQTWNAGTRLYPVRTAQFERGPKLTRLTDELQKTRVEFAMVEPCDWPAVTPPTTYRGAPVYDATPDETDDLTSEFHQLLLTLDSGFGKAPLLTNTADLSLPVQVHRWKLFGRAERSAFRSFMYFLNGRQKRAWIPTHADDLTLVAPVSNISTIIDVAAIGYSRFAVTRKNRRDIRIQLFNGTVFYRRIISAAEVSADVERLQIDSALGIAVNPADVFRISWLNLMRANSDTVEINHITDGDGVASSEQVFIGVADDV